MPSAGFQGPFIGYNGAGLYLCANVKRRVKGKTLKKMRPLPRESTAFHEAGHALVGHLLGWKIDTIVITGTENVRGYTLRRRQQTIPGVVDFDIKREQSDDGLLTDHLTYLYAGIVAHRFLCAHRGVSAKPVRLGHDIRTARNEVRNLSKADRIELLRSAEKHAMQLLADLQNWQTLERVAAKLFELGELHGPPLFELLSGSQDALF